jgi:anti-anti-sigma factor
MGGNLVDALGWDGHLALLHESESERLSRMAAWVRRGLERDEKVFYNEPATESGRLSTLRAMREHGVDVAAATAAGHLQPLLLADLYPPEGQVRVVEHALAEGYRAVRISGQASEALSVLSERSYFDTERAMDVLCREYPVSALCQYDAVATGDAMLRQAVAVHVHGVRHAHLHTGSARRGGLVLAGELDASNAALLLEVLRAATARASGTFVLDVRGVSFFGVAAARGLVEGTWEFRWKRGTVLVTGVAPHVRRALELLEALQLQGLRVLRG